MLFTFIETKKEGKISRELTYSLCILRRQTHTQTQVRKHWFHCQQADRMLYSFFFRLLFDSHLTSTRSLQGKCTAK